MSTLQDLQKIKTDIGEKMYQEMEKFLSFHPELLLSDIYYNKENFQMFLEWNEKTPNYLKNAEPIYLVIENYKGISEHDFFGTKEEICDSLSISERELENLFYQQGEKSFYYARSNVSYSISVAKTEEDLLRFFNGNENDLEQMENDSDWYYDLDLERCGENAKKTLTQIAASTENPELFRVLVEKLALLEVKRERADLQTGVVHVYAWNKKLTTFCDEICRQKPDGTFTDGLHDKVHSYRHYGPVLAGWGSIIPDENFIMISAKDFQKEIQNILKESCSHKKPKIDTLITEGKQKLENSFSKEQSGIKNSKEKEL